MPHGREFTRDRLRCLLFALLRQSTERRGPPYRLDLRDEPLVDAEDMVCVVAPKPEKSEDVLNGYWRRVGKKAEFDRAVVLDLHRHLLVSQDRQFGVNGRRA